MPLKDLCDIITSRRFTDADREEVRRLSPREREQLIHHAEKSMADMLAGADPEGRA